MLTKTRLIVLGLAAIATRCSWIPDRIVSSPNLDIPDTFTGMAALVCRITKTESRSLGQRAVQDTAPPRQSFQLHLDFKQGQLTGWAIPSTGPISPYYDSLAKIGAQECDKGKKPQTHEGGYHLCHHTGYPEQTDLFLTRNAQTLLTTQDTAFAYTSEFARCTVQALNFY